MITESSSFLILFSGGFDSYVTTEYIIQKYKTNYVRLLNIHYGQVNDVELYTARRLFEHLKEKYPKITIEFQKLVIPKELTSQLFSLSSLVNKNIKQEGFIKNNQPTTYVPFRNQLFLTIAGIIAENNNIKYIATGIQPHTEYYYWDATEDFVLKLNNLFSLNPKQITIIAPFKNKTKEQIYKIAKEELKLSDNELALTWSCYNPKLTDIKQENGIIKELVFKTCGKCGSCKERLEMGIPDSFNVSVPYNKNNHQELILSYILRKTKQINAIGEIFREISKRLNRLESINNKEYATMLDLLIDDLISKLS